MLSVPISIKIALNILCITHANFKSPSVIDVWAERCGHTLTICRPYAGDCCPDMQDFDVLIVRGGPQRATELERYPYLKDEIALISKAILQDKLVLGICLGNQLVAKALGAETLLSPEKEVGVWPVVLTEEGVRDKLFDGLPRSLSAFHWHNDMAGEIEGATVLARSAGCPRQVVRYDERVYGFQCHFEVTQTGIENLIARYPEDLQSEGLYIQSAQDLQGQDFDCINEVMFTILERFVAQHCQE